MVILGHGSLSFVDLNGDCVLVISGSRENLGLLGRDDSVSGDQLSHHTSDGLNAKSERVDIEKDDLTGVLFSRQDSSLNSSTISDGLVRVDTSRWLLTIEELLDELLNLGDTS